ncbi:MAG: MarR family transcriptional regulator [Thermaerobacter sp.]|nr:MarR family transcriptional regulator [Thermaerobacter sp.]
MADRPQPDDVVSDLFALFGIMRRVMRSGGIADLGPSHHMVLMRLREDAHKGHGTPRGPSRITELAQFLHLTPAAITQLVTELESRGLVARERNAKDRRAVVVRLTGFGVEALQELRVRRLAVAEQMLKGIPLEDRKELARILHRIAESNPTVE